jgi:hypothetical protein
VPIGQSDWTAHSSSEANLRDFGRVQGAALAQAVLEDIFTLITTANFGLATAVSSTVIDVAHLRKARLLLNQSNVPLEPRSAILDCVPYDVLLGVTNFVQAHMFRDNNVLADGRIMRALGMDFFEVNSPFVSTYSVMGFCCHPSSIAIAMRYLAPQVPEVYLNARAVADPETGMVFGIREHADPNTGTKYINLEAAYGYAAGITTAGRILKRLD